MPIVTYQDGSTFTLPEPEGEKIQQVSKRINALTDDYSKYTEDEVAIYMDDIIYLLLDHWKAHSVTKPLDQLARLVDEDKLEYRSPVFKELFETRVKQDRDLVAAFMSTDDAEYKEVLKGKLKARGFIGVRKVKTL